jgi:hypothetical protein
MESDMIEVGEKVSASAVNSSNLGYGKPVVSREGTWPDSGIRKTCDAC